ncbi:MAG: hypothetical protein JOZ25_08535, partial [Actinobacteria bacterium]|nr:hypothetical protein [Actinomycetota bacterium]
KGPTKLTFSRRPGHLRGRLAWRPARGAGRHQRYRVYRDSTVVGQTRKHWMRIRVSLDRRFKLTVRPVTRRGRPLRCAARLRVTVKYVAPSRPQNLSVSGTSGAAAHLTWDPSHGGDGKLAGYRVLRNGATFRQTRATSEDVPISSNRSYHFSVLAVDRHGKLSGESNPVTVVTGHDPPPAPTNVIATPAGDGAVSLSWGPSLLQRGRLAGYRIYRDGKVVGQVQGLSTTVSNLFDSTDYTFTVAAVDTLGYLSQPSAQATVKTSPPVQSTGKAQAFVLATTDASFADFRAHYQEIGTVYPTYFNCAPDATWVGQDDPLVTQWAQARGVKVLPRMNCQNSALLDQVLNDANLRSQWIDNIVSLVQANGYDGTILDFEAGYASDRSAYTSFVTELASRLHAIGKLLSVAVSAKTHDVPNHPRSTFFDYQSLALSADTIVVMAWGIHWMTSAPGAQDDITWVRQVVSYVGTLNQPGRFVLGMQLYGMDWPNGGGVGNPATSREYADVVSLAAQYGVTPAYDSTENGMHFSYDDPTTGTHHDLWFSNADTEANLIQLAHDNGMGVGFWRLGREDQRLWSNPLLQG